MSTAPAYTVKGLFGWVLGAPSPTEGSVQQQSPSPSPQRARRVASPSPARAAASAQGVDADDERRLRRVADAYTDVYKMAELRALATYAPAGMYVTPRLGDWHVWEGVIFPVRGGIYRFRILLDDAFPNSMPRVRFVYPPFHPLVDEAGWMQLHRRFPRWEPGKCQLWQVLEYIKESLLAPDASDSGYANDEAAYLLARRPEEYEERAAEALRRCTELVHKPLPPEFRAQRPAHLRAQANGDHDADEDETVNLVDDVLQLVDPPEATLRAIKECMHQFTAKVDAAGDESNVELWLGDFLENMHEAVEATLPPRGGAG